MSEPQQHTILKSMPTIAYYGITAKTIQASRLVLQDFIEEHTLRVPVSDLKFELRMAGLQLLASLTGLQKLEISCREAISDAGVSHLCHLTTLTELIFQSDQVEPKVSLLSALKPKQGSHCKLCARKKCWSLSLATPLSLQLLPSAKCSFFSRLICSFSSLASCL